MGLLTKGSPLSWEETVPYIDYIKEHGIKQFIALYHRLKDRQGDQLRWGDEIEYTIVKFDHENRKVRVSLRAEELLGRLQAAEEVNALVGTANSFLWRPEYAAYMIEGTPGVPYGGLLACFNVVENNMKKRREEVSSLLKKDESVMSISFPFLGVTDFTTPHAIPFPDSPNAVSQSLFFPDEAIYQGHVRFVNLTRNIRRRRGEKVAINVPIFKDVNTPSPFLEELGRECPTEKDHIYMDAMGFGMGCCCLQVTFQAVNVNEARWLYDQLTPITPILLALSAATPVFRGYLADVDSRWDIISASVDDRTRDERGLEPLKKGHFVLNKSRYDTTDTYIYPCSSSYNDVQLEYDESIYEQLLRGGIDVHLARHIAHMFIRDPLQVFRERLSLEKEEGGTTEHFETLQSSNWMNMRFKPPPPDQSDVGWRVEFRPTEVQLTDFENAAYCSFVVLLTRVIISFRLTFLLPISKVNENMKRAQQRDAVLTQRFFFRKGLHTCNTPTETATRCRIQASEDIVEMSIDEIINGKGDEFPGLITLIKQYLDSADVDVDARCTISQYMQFIQQRSNGQISTLAHWIREFVAAHPDYKQDSVVSDSTGYDLLSTMDNIAKGERYCEKLLGSFRSKTKNVIPTAVRRAEESQAMSKAVSRKPQKSAAASQNGL